MNRLESRLGALLLALLFSVPTLAAPAADEILVANPYVRAVPPMMQNSALFVTLKNTGSSDRALVSASSRAAQVVELHTHVNDGGVMRMREVERIDIAAGQATVLEPGGLHVMLIGLKRPLEVGTTVQVDLTFDDGSSKSVVAPVKSVMGMHGGPMHGGGAAAAQPAEALSPVFVNLTTDDDWRASMALHWAGVALRRGHPVTVWLNVDAVRLAVGHIAHPVHSMQDKTAQEMMQDLMRDGGKVLVCGGCLKRAGFNREQLIGGVEMGHPDKVMPAIFDEKTKVISW
jgi:copper(I)-binding protein/predicted peroxiredoxin